MIFKIDTKMTNILIAVVMFFISSFGCSNKEESKKDLHVVTFNVRYDNPDDGPNRWEMRVPLIESYFAKEMPDIIGMQEVKHNQIIDLQKILPGFAYVGTGRDDGKQGGEYTPIFYKKDKFSLLENSQFWLSETPEVPGSIGWDAAITRIVTWAKFEDKFSGKTFCFFNTHFDHRGVKAREMSPFLLSDKIAEIAVNSPVILTGDFNIQKNNATLGSAVYDNLIETLKSKNALNSAELITETPVTTTGSTSTGFRPNWTVGESGDAIDYIFVNEYFKVKSYRVDRIVKDSIFISDHWPVIARLVIE
jgi:endonuclease/exonuclease/phosphatase family metal-dependent hydrolase